MLKKLLFIIIFLLFCNTVSAQIYKWVEKDGSVHFSDRPQPGISAAVVSTPAEKPSHPAAIEKTKTITASAEKSSSPPSFTISIVQPDDKSTIFDNNGTITINTRVEPAVSSDDAFQVILDGNPFGERQTTMPLKITGVDRGEHQLSVQLQDKEGNALATSNSITIYLHKAIVK